MTTIGVRELRQNASEVLREVEAGDTATVTVAGRPVAKIVPILGDSWVSWERAKSVFSSPTDPEWDAQRREFGVEEISDPWDR
jgi:prevent-host-death family protein